MTIKEKILEEIKDINYAYNDCSKYETIKNLLEKMEEGRKKGKWIYHKGLSESRECSCCHVWFDWDMPRNSFCPNCGADMREEKEDD